jgi:5'-methylthioadenosine phosphorylase
MPKERSCKCGSALEFAIMTERTRIPQDTRERLHAILGEYVEPVAAGKNQ